MCIRDSTDNNSIVIYDGENVTELKTEIGNVLSADVGTLAGNSYLAVLVNRGGQAAGRAVDVGAFLPGLYRVKQRDAVLGLDDLVGHRCV